MRKVATNREQWDRVTLKEMYLKYPYKWKDLNSSTVPLPYFSSKEITNTEHSISYKKWKEIVNKYLEVLMDYMQDGLPYEMPHNIGHLQVRKVKGKGVDWQKTKEKYGLHKGKEGIPERVYMDNSFSDGYYPTLKWYRLDKQLRHKWLWNAKSTKVCKRVLKHWNEDNSNVYKILDV